MGKHLPESPATTVKSSTGTEAAIDIAQVVVPESTIVDEWAAELEALSKRPAKIATGLNTKTGTSLNTNAADAANAANAATNATNAATNAATANVDTSVNVNAKWIGRCVALVVAAGAGVRDFVDTILRNKVSELLNLVCGRQLGAGLDVVLLVCLVECGFVLFGDLFVAVGCGLA